jgi:hypothetical protein
VGPQFGPKEFFDLLGALGFARRRRKGRLASGGPRFGWDKSAGAGIDPHPRQDWANGRIMLLSHHVASGDMRLVRPYQVEGELEPAFPLGAGIDSDQEILQGHLCLTTGSKRKRREFAGIASQSFRSLIIWLSGLPKRELSQLNAAFSRFYRR